MSFLDLCEELNNPETSRREENYLENEFMDLNVNSFEDLSEAMNEVDQENLTEEQIPLENSLKELSNIIQRDSKLTIYGTEENTVGNNAVKAAQKFGRSKSEWPYQLKLLINAYRAENWLKNNFADYKAALVNALRNAGQTDLAESLEKVNRLKFIGNHASISLDFDRNDDKYKDYRASKLEWKKLKSRYDSLKTSNPEPSETDSETLKELEELENDLAKLNAKLLSWEKKHADFRPRAKKSNLRLEAKVVKRYPGSATDFHSADIVLIIAIDTKKLYMKYRKISDSGYTLDIKNDYSPSIFITTADITFVDVETDEAVFSEMKDLEN